MPALTLPLTFTNSFWSQVGCLSVLFVILPSPRYLRVNIVQDYRRGLETLFSKLEQVQSTQGPPGTRVSLRHWLGRRRER
jgi:hypothetical protein